MSMTLMADFHCILTRAPCVPLIFRLLSDLRGDGEDSSRVSEFQSLLEE